MAVSPNTILGKYRIIREIARSNDIVYEAIDPKMNRRVAIKELQLPLHLAGTQKRERVERFYREAKAAGTLTHPNIVTIHEVGQENERHFLVMEYLDGQSLRDILQLQGALPLRETVEIALQLCDALSYAHSHGVVHRDVKPDNVHILPGGIIKLTDFGIARITAEPSITSQGQVFGTPSYMSPEQVASQAVDHRTDLFSLAITLYEMLTGRKPFVGDSVITITYNIMNSQPPMPVGIPQAMQAILQKGLAKDANARYQSAAAMAADLRAEKFALASPQAGDSGRGRLSSLTNPPTPAPMDTGHIPPPVSPGVLSQQPAQMPAATPEPAPPPPASVANGAAPNSAPGGYPATHIAPMVGGLAPSDSNVRSGKRRGSSSRLRGALSMAIMVLALILLLLLVVWGGITAYHSLQGHGRRAEAQPLYQEAVRLANSPPPAASPAAPAPTPQTASIAPPIGPGLGQYALPQAALAPTPPRPAAPSGEAGAQSAAAYDAQGNQRWQQNDPDGALAAWEQAVQAAPVSPAADDARRQATRVYMERGDRAAAANDFAGARNAWQHVIMVNPGSTEAAQAQDKITRSPLPSGLDNTSQG